MLDRVRDYALAPMTKTDRVVAWIVNDTGLPKKGSHSVGVARQYCGQTGKQDNCQVAVSLSVATWNASLPIAYRLYLPEAWANDSQRRQQAKIPSDVLFRPSWRSRWARSARPSRREFRRARCWPIRPTGTTLIFAETLAGMELDYVVGVPSTTTVWPLGTGPLPPPPYSGRGQPPRRLRRDPEHTPLSAKQLALSLPIKTWKTVTWREGSAVSCAPASPPEGSHPPCASRPQIASTQNRGVAADRVASR